MFKTLGITNSINSSVALFFDGNLISAVSEESFSRKKNDDSFPSKSIKYILEKNKIKSLKQIDCITYSWFKGLTFETLKNILERYKLELKTNKKNIRIFENRLNIEIKRDKKKRQEIDNWIKKNKLEKKFVDFHHHEGHALSATLFSPFDKSLCVTCDARGDFESLVIWDFNRKRKECLKKILSIPTNDSLGFFYARITGLLGFKPNRHEGKITGLAAHGNSKKTINLMKKMISIKNNKLIGNNGDYFKPFFKPYSKKIIKEIKKYKKEDIAAGAQKHLEDILKFLVNRNIGNRKYLCLAGGVFSNVKLNYELKKLKKIKSIYVQPQMGDGGLCLGSAAGFLHKNSYKINTLYNCKLGFENNPAKINNLIAKYNLDEIKSNKHDYIINSFIKGKVLGVVKGKMEFGPRALLNRSILYKTSDETCNNWLNKRMNRTEFMPFAPVTTEKLAKKSFIKFDKNDLTMKFMTSTILCKNIFKKKSPAVCHIDNTARPQIVFKKDDNFMYKLIQEWNKKTGELALINTSFNSHEEPIVRTYEDGLKELKKGVVDLIMLENRLFEKKK